MAFREVSMNKIREVLRVWLGVAGLPARGAARSPRIAVWTARRCGATWRPAQAPGLPRDDDVSAIDDGLIGAVADAVRPARPDGHGAAWEQLLGVANCSLPLAIRWSRLPGKRQLGQSTW
ncbi:hypothetical protein ACQKB1_03860 [Mycobacterium tuberculosis]